MGGPRESEKLSLDFSGCKGTGGKMYFQIFQTYKILSVFHNKVELVHPVVIPAWFISQGQSFKSFTLFQRGILGITFDPQGTPMSAEHLATTDGQIAECHDTLILH